MTVAIVDDSSYRTFYNTGERQATITIKDLKPDIAIDSNNDGDITTADDPIEEQSTGKIIAVNDDDTDGDGITDFADGFNAWNDINQDILVAGERFVPIQLTIPNSVNVNTATFRIEYDGSDPAGVTRSRSSPADPWDYTAPAGALRLWTRPPTSKRKADRFDGITGYSPADPTGYYVAPSGQNQSYTSGDLKKLGFSAGTRTITLWAEGIHPSAAGGDKTITFSIDPDGDANGTSFVAADKVSTTVVAVHLTKTWSDQFANTEINATGTN